MIQLNLINEERFTDFFEFLSNCWIDGKDLDWDFKFAWKPLQVKLSKKAQPYVPKTPNSLEKVPLQKVSFQDQVNWKLDMNLDSENKIQISVLLKSAKGMGNLQAWSAKIKQLRDENGLLKWFLLNDPHHIMLEIERFKSSFTEEEISKLRQDCSQYERKDA